MNKEERKKATILWAIALFGAAMAAGFGSNIYSNYFNEVFKITSVQRGILEIPREGPAILCMIIVSILGFLGNIKLAVIAQGLCLVGYAVLGFLSPTYYMMMAFMFLASLGEHLFMPLNDSISMAMAEKGNEGETLGKFKSIHTMGYLASAGIVFLVFKFKIFTFATKILPSFVCSTSFTLIAITALCLLTKYIKPEDKNQNKKLLIRKEYIPYYLVTIAFGWQKRIRLVFAPWVIINLLHKGADTIALLAIITHFVGMIISPIVGKMLDKYGARKALIGETIYVVISFAIMGYISKVLVDNGMLSTIGSIILFLGYVLCNLLDKLNLIHAYMMRSIAIDKKEVARTLSVGLSLDHVMAVIASPILGIVWETMGVEFVFYLSCLSIVLQIIGAQMIKDINVLK